MALSPYASVVVLPKADSNNTILDFLDRKFSRIGREVWKKRIQRGKVLDEKGHPITLDTPYVPETKIHYFREVEKEPVIPFKEQILFENNHLIVACKPHFLPVIPSGPYVNECLLNRLKRKTGNPDLTPINRIDRETAGLVLFSVGKKSRGLYQALFMEEKVKKTYEAVTELPEKIETGKWHIENRIVKGTPWFRMKIEKGEINARTTAEIIARKKNRALFRLHPHTGKKHQLRLHLSNLGCRIINDRYYPDLLPQQDPDFKNPLQLLAKKIAFTDPISGREVEFFSPRRLAW